MRIVLTFKIVYIRSQIKNITYCASSSSTKTRLTKTEERSKNPLENKKSCRNTIADKGRLNPRTSIEAEQLSQLIAKSERKRRLPQTLNDKQQPITTQHTSQLCDFRYYVIANICARNLRLNTIVICTNCCINNKRLFQYIIVLLMLG